MKIRFSASMKKFLQGLEDEADKRNMRVDWETLTLVPLTGVPKSWPQGDRVPRDYEGGEDE
jgi:hypothetical protein